MSDDEVNMLKMAQKSPKALEPLYIRYAPRIYAYCARRLPDSQEVEDVCSQIFVRVLKSLNTYRGGLVSAWLFKIAQRTLVDHYRQHQKVVSIQENDHVDERAQWSFDAIDADSERLRFFQHLTPKQAELLSLYIDGELTSVEIAEITGKSSGAVRVELHRIFKHLRQQLQETSL